MHFNIPWAIKKGFCGPHLAPGPVHSTLIMLQTPTTWMPNRKKKKAEPLVARDFVLFCWTYIILGEAVQSEDVDDSEGVTVKLSKARVEQRHFSSTNKHRVLGFDIGQHFRIKHQRKEAHPIRYLSPNPQLYYAWHVVNRDTITSATTAPSILEKRRHQI